MSDLWAQIRHAEPLSEPPPLSVPAHYRYRRVQWAMVGHGHIPTRQHYAEPLDAALDAERTLCGKAFVATDPKVQIDVPDPGPDCGQCLLVIRRRLRRETHPF